MKRTNRLENGPVPVNRQNWRLARLALCVISLTALLGNSAGAALQGADLSAPAYSVLKHFSMTNRDGWFPLAGLTTSGGALYGTTYYGGNFGNGVVFRLETNGAGYAVLKHFAGGDGERPMAGLALNGSLLYGTTEWGGRSNRGTLFRINANGSDFVVLKNFTGPEGWNLKEGLTVSNDLIFGTANLGGASDYGTLFRLNANGTGYSVLRSFNNADGRYPTANHLTLSGETLYGTTHSGGRFNFGTVFRVKTNGTGFTVLKDFTGADGAHPQGGVALSGDTLFGTAYAGGSSNLGTVFKLNTDGSGFAVLKTFNGPDGKFPNSALALSGVTLYGTTQTGGHSNTGTVFAVNTDGSSFRVLHHFTGADGSEPSAGVLYSEGVLYGTTHAGGEFGWGTVFRLEVGGVAPPNITAHPQSQTVRGGQTVAFNVSASGSPPLFYQWFKDAMPVALATHRSHSVSNLQSSDAGVYSVVVSNAAGTVTSSPALLSVLRAPVVSQECNSIANTPSLDEFARSSAFDGANFLIGVRGASGNPAAVGAQMISPEGVLLGPLVTNGQSVGRVPDRNVFSAAPYVAFGASIYLIAWTDAGLGNDVQAQFVSSAGDFVGNPFSVAPETAEDEDAIAVASDGTNFLVLWSSPNGLFGRLLSPVGQLSNLLQFTTEDVQAEAGVAFGGGKYLVSWVEGTDGAHGTWARFVSATGEMEDEVMLSEIDSYLHNPVNVAYGRNRFMVAWHHNASEEADWNLRGRILELDGSLPGGELRLADGSNDDLAFGTSLVFDGQYFLLVWTDLVGSPSGLRGTALGRRWTHDGRPLTDAFLIADSGVGQVSVGVSAGAGQAIVLVHTNIFTSFSDVCAKFVSLPPAVGPLLLTPGPVESGRFGIQLLGPAGATAVLESSATMENWTPIATNVLSADPWTLALPVGSNALQFFRGRLP